MYNHKWKNLLLAPIMIIAFVMTFSQGVFAETGADVSQLLKEFEDSDNPIDSSIINSNTDITANNMDTLDNAMATIYAEPAVSDHYDAVCPLFYRSSLSGIKMFVGGKLVEFSKYGSVEPVRIEGRVFVPVRAIAEGLGATVDWDAAARSVRIRLLDKELAVVLDSKDATVNGKQVSMDVPAKVIDGRTMVPVRFIGEALSRTVEWHPYNERLNVIAIY